MELMEIIEEILLMSEPNANNQEKTLIQALRFDNRTSIFVKTNDQK